MIDWVYTYVYIYIYIEREREIEIYTQTYIYIYIYRERERHVYVCVYIYIYIYDGVAEGRGEFRAEEKQLTACSALTYTYNMLIGLRVYARVRSTTQHVMTYNHTFVLCVHIAVTVIVTCGVVRSLQYITTTQPE